MNFKKALSAGLLAAASFSMPALADPLVFGYTGGFQTFTASASGVYVVNAIGAQGGHGTITEDGRVGGRGASITGSFNLSAGDTFWLAVGGMGSSIRGSYNGGGGGGSFFVSVSGIPMLVAGGGGGIRSFAGQNGCDASITAFGVSGSGGSPTSSCNTKSTDLGQGGIVSSGSWGSAGGGFFSNGAGDGPWGFGGRDYLNGLLGGGNDAGASPTCSSTGGFGGGGSGSGCGGGGGGGGYSGGDGGWIGGGGGSWNTGFDQEALAGVGEGNGLISIEFLGGTVPEPSVLALLSIALLGLGLTRSKRGR